jgi:ABC-type dipeptide/oligopeptide/nickel transport system ATPase component
MIAMSIACDPKLLIADEPTTALDVTIQARILELLRELQRDSGMSVLFITHDLGVVADIARHVVVMYGAQVVESADVDSLFGAPRHPYTSGLRSNAGTTRSLSRARSRRHTHGPADAASILVVSTERKGRAPRQTSRWSWSVVAW